MQKVPPIKELKKLCVKDYEVRVNKTLLKKFARSCSILITKCLLYTPISPNQVTWVMMILSIAAPFLFIPGDYVLSVIGSLLLLFVFVLDHVDGEIARYRKVYSKKGPFLDYMSALVIHPLTFGFIGLGVYQHYPYFIVLVMSIVVAVCSLLFYALYDVRYSFYFDQVQKDAPELGGKKKAAQESKVSRKVAPRKESLFEQVFNFLRKMGGKFYFIFKFDRLTLLVIVAALANAMHIFFLIYALLYPILILFIIISMYSSGIDAFVNEMNKRLKK